MYIHTLHMYIHCTYIQCTCTYTYIVHAHTYMYIHTCTCTCTLHARTHTDSSVETASHAGTLSDKSSECPVNCN